MTTTAETAPFRFFDLQVVRTRRLGPSMVRVTFGGERPQATSPPAAATSPCRSSCRTPARTRRSCRSTPATAVVLAAWRALPDDVRAVMRSYTVREQRHEPGEARRGRHRLRRCTRTAARLPLGRPGRARTTA